MVSVSKEEPRVGGITHSLKRLTPLLRVFYLRCRWQPVVMKVTRRAWGDCKVNLCCSREGVWLYAKFDSTQFHKKHINPSSYVKVMTVLPMHVRVMVLEGGI
jgi:hypothetical protein